MEGYKKLDNVEVVACCDKIEAAVETYQKEFDIPQGFTDLDKMLSIAKPEIISVCVWHLLHDEITIQAANSPYVKGIICEKPMARSVQECRAMISAANNSGKILMLGFMKRYDKSFLKAAEMLRDGDLEDIGQRGQEVVCARRLVRDHIRLDHRGPLDEPHDPVAALPYIPLPAPKSCRGTRRRVRTERRRIHPLRPLK